MINRNHAKAKAATGEPEDRLPAAPEDCQALCSAALAMEEIFAADGLLAHQLPGFEAREGQLAMARAVAATLADQQNKGVDPYLEQDGRNYDDPHAATPPRDHSQRLLLAEAGTGTGKTLAYLIPAVLSGRKVVVSTNTINLQEQILAKEIPFIRRHLAPGLKALCVKGRQNYLCLYRWHQLQVNPQGRLFKGSAADHGEQNLETIAAWLNETHTGDRGELRGLADDSPLWAGISAAAGHCLGSSCPHGADCFITRLRQRAARAQLLIVNHHLFFSDLAVRRFGHAEVLPRYEAVIFDEAHHLENIATRHFGLSLSHYQIIDLVRDLEAMAEARLRERDRAGVVQTARALAAEAGAFLDFFPSRRGRFPLRELIAAEPIWPELCQSLTTAFTAVIRPLEELARKEEIWGPVLRRCQDLLATFKTITNPPPVGQAAAEQPPGHASMPQLPRNTDGLATSPADGDQAAPPAPVAADAAIYWYERREKTVQLAVSPIDVAGHLQEHLYRQVKAAVFTSATLRTGNDFRYVKARLGLPADCPALDLATPFDYANRTLLYVPDQDFPEPNQPAYPARARQAMREIIGHSRGRALLLFTSISAMRQAAEELAGCRLPYPVLVQGEAPRSLLLEEFRRQTRSVLLAVASFWEGVDVPGESLSCVIIDKLPFEVPSDPVIMARVDKIKAEGGNPFFDFQVPRAVLTLRQGVGRLMRATNDRGVLAILDVRLFNKGYGRIFLKSLPPSPLSRELGQVKKFFSREQT
ncbi:ATP-dependent DNA helicase [Desulfurivibrio dismutans]|uniref:ATP-dependent DNA helicase n=1 Tax=Desulfurivibrio dismutans TaxID=1398908 RepID=UPI0023DC7630|nr:ATP-dependent DNA helicase [Desulfurivibrio alkaliphilus]MDF1613769.1 ATP-dependent DNA helicase [Desulfurivibrio alkaliphilus]